MQSVIWWLIVRCVYAVDQKPVRIMIGVNAYSSMHRYSPTLQSLSVTGRRKVRRAKLYYLRDRKPNEYRV